MRKASIALVFAAFFAFFAAVLFADNEKLLLVTMGKPLTKNSDIIAGTSGSPVYFKHDGKWLLAGAISIGLNTFTINGNLAGITPISAIINQENPGNPADNDEFVSWNQLQKGQKGYCLTVLEGTKIQKIDVWYLGAINHPNSVDSKTTAEDKFFGKIQFYPIPLAPYKAITAAQTQTATAKNKYRRPAPGDSTTIMLSDGNYQTGPTGTITYVKGNSFWALGHPILSERGTVNLPAYRSEIILTSISEKSSFKLPQGKLEKFGTIVYNGPFGIRGEIAPKEPAPAMLPVKITINANGKKMAYNMDLTLHPSISQSLLKDALEKFIGNVWSGDTMATIKIQTDIAIEGQEPLVLSAAIVAQKEIQRMGPFSIEHNPLDDLVESTVDTITNLALNKRWPMKVKSVQISFDIAEGTKILSLDTSLVIDALGRPAKEVKRGDKVYIVLIFRNRDSEENYAISAEIEIPKDLDLVEPAQNSRYLPLAIFVQSGTSFTEKNPKKISLQEPDTREEFLDRLRNANGFDPAKIYLQVCFPPTRVAETKTPTIQINGSWTKIATDAMRGLRAADSQESRIDLKTYVSPDPACLFQANKSIQLNLLLE